MLEKPKKWYDKTGLIILWCVVFFPVGIYGLWQNEKISKGLKAGITSFFALILIFAVGSGDSIDNNEVVEFDIKAIRKEQLRTIAFMSEEDLKNSLKDPDSYENVSRDRVFLNDSVYKINIVYSATNSFGGRLRNNYIKTGVLSFNKKDSTFTNTVKFEKSF